MGCCLSKQDDDVGDSTVCLRRKAVVSSLPFPSKPLTRSSSCPVLNSSSTFSPLSPPSRSHSFPYLATTLCNPILPHPVPTEHSRAESPQLPILYTPPSLSLSTNLRLLGFHNSGNQCYRNATLQGLLGLVSFSSDLVTQIHCWEQHSSAPLLTNMANLQLSRLEGGSTRGLKKRKLLKNIQRCISEICPDFIEDDQQDAHEFLVFCLLKMKEEGLALSQVGASLRCPVANFEFQLLCTRTCNRCGYSLERMEGYNHLSIPTSDQDKLTDSLAQFFKATAQEYVCRWCSGRQATEEFQFATLPRVLVLHLNRFNDSSLEKNWCSIEFPLQLNLSSYQQRRGLMRPRMTRSLPELQCVSKQSPDVLKLAQTLPNLQLAQEQAIPVDCVCGEDALQLDRIASHLSNIDGNNTEYHLASVVSHLGYSREFGHYICDVAEGNGNDWLCFNDKKVSRKPKDYILQERASTAYLLFYVKSEKQEG